MEKFSDFPLAQSNLSNGGKIPNEYSIDKSVVSLWHQC